jgi:putative restriction endonuclease
VDPLHRILERLDPEHALALDWFAAHEGEIGPRPWRRHGQSVVPGVSVAMVAERGIHRPRGWDVALSITATKASLYMDGEPVPLGDGTWMLPYSAHTGADGVQLDSRWNQALVGNWIARIPVGVFLFHTRAKYRNLGLAMVEDYVEAADTFYLRGPVQFGQPAETWEADSEPTEDEPALLAAEEVSERSRVWIRRRHRQDVFRDALLSAYGSRCCVTDYEAEDALQGAHILAYAGRSSQSVRNGLLLRADIHLLFDRSLLAVEPDTLRVRLAPRLRSTAYGDLDGRRLALPCRATLSPDQAKLEVRWAVFAGARPADRV